jgi:hypothetical protein
MLPAFRINTKIDLYICSDNEELEDFNLQIQLLIGVADATRTLAPGHTARCIVQTETGVEMIEYTSQSIFERIGLSHILD